MVLFRQTFIINLHLKKNMSEEPIEVKSVGFWAAKDNLDSVLSGKKLTEREREIAKVFMQFGRAAGLYEMGELFTRGKSDYGGPFYALYDRFLITGNYFPDPEPQIPEGD